MESFINHPVHITKEMNPTAFIPYCSFGAAKDLIGKRVENVPFVACSLFTQKVLNGQVCYEANLNQLRKDLNWDSALKDGFSFVVDTNDEYLVENIVEKQDQEDMTMTDKDVYNFYGRYSQDNSFWFTLNTISWKIESFNQH